jgi:hypothetical protein
MPVSVIFFVRSTQNEDFFYIEDLPNTIPAKFGSNRHSSISEKHFCYIRNKNAYICPVFCQIKTKWGISVEDLLNIITAKFSSNWQCSFSQRRLKCEKFTDDGQRDGTDERRRTQTDCKSSQYSFSQVS